MLISSPNGIELVQEQRPDVDIYVAAIDEKLNETTIKWNEGYD